MPRQKEVFPIRKLDKALPALSLLRDLISEGLANVETKSETPELKLAHYAVLSGFQKRVDALLYKMTSQQPQTQPAMPPLL